MALAVHLSHIPSEEIPSSRQSNNDEDTYHHIFTHNTLRPASGFVY
jgi:hypothetical protein